MTVWQIAMIMGKLTFHKIKDSDQLYSNREADPDLYSNFTVPALIAQVVERPLWDREVAGSILGRAIPKA